MRKRNNGNFASYLDLRLTKELPSNTFFSSSSNIHIFQKNYYSQVQQVKCSQVQLVKYNQVGRVKYNQLLIVKYNKVQPVKYSKVKNAMLCKVIVLHSQFELNLVLQTDKKKYAIINAY